MKKRLILATVLLMSAQSAVAQEFGKADENYILDPKSYLGCPVPYEYDERDSLNHFDVALDFGPFTTLKLRPPSWRFTRWLATWVPVLGYSDTRDAAGQNLRKQYMPGAWLRFDGISPDAKEIRASLYYREPELFPKHSRRWAWVQSGRATEAEKIAAETVQAHISFGLKECNGRTLQFSDPKESEPLSDIIERFRTPNFSDFKDCKLEPLGEITYEDHAGGIEGAVMPTNVQVFSSSDAIELTWGSCSGRQLFMREKDYLEGSTQASPVTYRGDRGQPQRRAGAEADSQASIHALVQAKATYLQQVGLYVLVIDQFHANPTQRDAALRSFLREHKDAMVRSLEAFEDAFRKAPLMAKLEAIYDIRRAYEDLEKIQESLKAPIFIDQAMPIRLGVFVPAGR